jgi:hypothetical protein
MAEATIATPGVKSKKAEHERPSGKSTPRAKLSAHEIGLLAEMLEDGMTTEEIAARFA